MGRAKVVVAMSGGVDSSTAACLLVKQGYDVIGVSMRLFIPREVSDSGCCGIQGIDDARNVAQKIGIPFYALSHEKEFENKVIKYFCREYETGRTPNPCIICNEKIKFGSLLEKAASLGAEYIATGHYARVGYDKLSKRYLLKKGKDKAKDQSYFLFSLTQEQLKHTLFPLGDYTKSEVRRLAKEFGLRVHDKPASQEICFVTDADYRRFLETQFPADKFKSGSIIDGNGKVLGKHQGISFYTVGQRKGIGAHKKPFYVIAIDKKKNTVVIGEEKELYRDTLIAENINWIVLPADRQGRTGSLDPVPDELPVIKIPVYQGRKKLIKPIRVKTKIRYKHLEGEATVYPLGNGKVKVKFTKPQRAITPGQAVVFYKGEMVIGGGWII